MFRLQLSAHPPTGGRERESPEAHIRRCVRGVGDIAALLGRSATTNSQAASISSHWAETQRTPEIRFPATLGRAPEVELTLA